MGEYINIYKDYDKHRFKPKTVVTTQDREPEKNTGGLLGGIGYTAGKLGLGVAGVGEGVLDTGAAIFDVLRGDLESAKDRYKENVTGDLSRDLEEWYNPNGVMRFVGDTASGIGQSSVFLLDAVAPGLGTGLFFTGVGGQNVASAAEQTGNVGWRELGYGAASAGLEAVIGKAIGAGGQATKQLGGAILKSTGKTAAKKAAQTAVTKRAWTSVGKEVLKSAIGEGVEEGVSEVADTWLLQHFGIDEDAETSILDVLYAAGVGAVSGGLMTAGPAAINYNQTVKAGRAVKDAGEVDILLQRAKNAVAGATRAENRAAGEVVKGADKYDKDANVFSRAASWNKATLWDNRRAKKESRQAKQIRETLEKNITGYENLSEAVRNSEGGDALLGNMLGNVYLLENAYRVDLTEELMTRATPEMKQAFVDDINAKAKATGQKKTDYTVQDLDNDVDGIRRTYASSAVYEMMLEKMYGVGNAKETAEEAQEGAEKVKDEEVSGEVETGAPEDIWLPLDDYEAVGGYGINNEREAALLQAAKRQGVPAASVPSMLNIFRQDELSPEDFAEGWQQGVGVFGRYNVTDIPEKSALGRMKSYNRDAAFQIGRALASEEAMRREKKAEKKKAPAKSRGVDVEKVRVTGTGAERGQSLEEVVSTPKTEGRVIKEKGVYIRDAGEGAYVVYKASELMAKVLGADIHIHKTLGNRDVGKINGYYDVSDNTIHIALDAGKDARGTALFTLAHEVTHYIREWSPAKFEALSDFVGERMGADMEGLMTRKAELLRKMPQFKDKTVTELNDAAHEEVIADAMETILSDGTVMEDLATYDKSLWEKIKDFIVDLIKKIKKAYGELSPNSQAAKVLKETVDDMSEIQRLWAEGVREAGERTRTAGVETRESSKTPKYDIAVLEDGKMFVYASRNVISGTGVDHWRSQITKFFKELLDNKASLDIHTQEGDVLTLTMDQTEYKARDNYKQVGGNRVPLADSEFLVKLHAESHIDELAEIARKDKRPPVEDGKEHDFAKDGFTYRTAYFRDFDGKYYKIRFSIGHSGDVATVYNVGQIKEDVLPSAKLIAVVGSKGPWSTSSKGSITQPTEKVNRKFSISDNSLVEKYPNLNLNQDVSDMDGVPAIQLEDGSVLTFTEPHVTFIQNNGIDVEDIRSGGWIVDGVYEPSERSDTLRYKERMLAKKRMDEKRASKKGDIRFSIEETKEIPSTLSTEDQGLLFDADFYERYENESREPIKETVEELEAVKASEAFTTMSDDEVFDLNAKLKAKRAGYDTVYDYYVETEKERMAEEYRRYVQTGRSNRTSRTLEEKRKKAQKERTLRSDVDSATPLQIAQYQIIQETNPMWDEYHTGIRSPKEIKTFAEAAKDPDSFTWGDFTREDAQKALRDGSVRVYSSYAIKNGVFVSTSYKQALQYAGNNPDGVHTRVVALDSVAWINGDEGQYAKVYKNDILYSIEETETQAPFAAAEARMEAEAAARAEAKTKAKTETEGDEIPDVYEFVDEEVTEDEIEAEMSEGEELSDRDMLIDMAERLVGNEEENKILESYKAQYGEQKERQKKLDNLFSEMDTQKSILYTDESAEKRSAAAKRLKEISTEIEKISEELGAVDRELTKIKDMKAIKNLLVRERKTARKIYQEKYRRMGEARKEATATTNMRRSFYRIYSRLNTMLLKPNRKKHVHYSMQGMVAEALKTANIDLDATLRLEQLNTWLTRAEREAVRDEAKIERYKSLIHEQEKKVTHIKDQVAMLVSLFEEFSKSTESEIAYAANAEVMEQLKALQEEIGERAPRWMTLEQLTALKDFYDMIYTRVTKANELFMSKKDVAVSEAGDTSATQVNKNKAPKVFERKERLPKALVLARNFLWQNMKPLTAFEVIGSSKLSELFGNVMDGEDVWARDVEAAYQFIRKLKDKTGFDKWDLKERMEVETSNGKKVKLSRGEIMSLYAYGFREQAEKHLTDGGFVLDPYAEDNIPEDDEKIKLRIQRLVDDPTRYRMDAVALGRLTGMLTEEQKTFVREMQTYLSDVMGEKGNEVSRKLYGVELFREKNYFPIKVSSVYLESHTGRTGDPNIKSRGMTKDTVPNANNPLILQDFMTVCNDHINSMSTYHAFVLPVEDLMRVLNYAPSSVKMDENGNPVKDEKGNYVSVDPDVQFNTVKAAIVAKYGQEAVSYIEQVIRDLNGGARRDAAASILDKGLTAFKRASTMASLSVIFQQPTSLFRAMAYVDPKYFMGKAEALSGKKRKERFDLLKKYAAVAVIKEMGGYDTNTGKRTGDYLNSKEYKDIREKMEAFFKPEAYGGDSNYRAEIFGKGAAIADEVTWVNIFSACIKEQSEKLNKAETSEEVLEAAGRRFTEVVRRTQVYDSTLTRNQLMRSKDTGAKMITTFMSEPSTVVNMVVDGMVRASRGDKAFAWRTAGGVAASILANALLVSLIYAARDDDEEKTFSEKYMSTLVTESLEGINTLEYLPIARDVMSIMKGYDVERSDMALIGQLVQSVENITSSKKSVPDKMMEVSGAVSSFFGVPLKNIYRDARGILTTAGDFFSDSSEKNTGTGMAFAIKDEFTFINKMFGLDSSNGYQMYKAILSGDEAHYNRVAARFSTPEAAESALRTAMRAHDERIYEAAEKRNAGDLEGYEAMVDKLASEGKFDRNLIIQAIRNESYELKKIAEKQAGMNLAPEADPEDDEADAAEGLYVTSDMTSAMERGDVGDLTAIIEQMVRDKVDSGKTEKEAKASLRSASTAYWKKRYIAAWEKNDAAEMRRIRNALEASGLYGGYNDMIAAVRSWIQNAK